MFSQAGQAIRDDADDRARRAAPRRLIAVGESQSAGRMVTYIDAVHPLVDVYDGFLVHSRSAGGAPLSQAPLPAVPTPVPTLIRDDLDVPVLVFKTETDAGVRAGPPARQPDSTGCGRWRARRTSTSTGCSPVRPTPDAAPTVAAWFDSMLHPTNQPNPGFTCGSPINTGPQTYVLRAAIAHLDRWVARGTPPPEAPRSETTSTAPVAYALDANGNVRGGIRTPAVDAPVARLSGLGQTGTHVLLPVRHHHAVHGRAARRAVRQPRAGSWRRGTRPPAVPSVRASCVPDDARHLRVVAAQSDILR